jgi:serine/threonine-protein kinase RsbW
MKAGASVTVKNNLSELERLNNSLSRFWTENQLPSELVMTATLALEEVFANIVLHGYRDSAEHEILVRMAVDDSEFVLSVEDDGVAFNPLEVPPVDTSLPLETRPVGGLGMHLVRSVMSEVEYARRDGRNRLQMKKHIPQGE